MKERIEKLLAEVQVRHADRRLDVFKVQVESAGADEVRLGGRVLTEQSLEEAQRAIAAAFPGVAVRSSGVRVLRARPGVMHTVGTTLTDLHVEPSFLSEMLTQVVNGRELEVLDEHPEGKWVFVRQADGYLGWAYKPYLQEGPAPTDATHLVCVPSLPVLREPQGPPISRLMSGTRVRVVDERGECSRVEVAGSMLPGGWVPTTALRRLDRLPVPPRDAGMQMLHDARVMTGVYYLWGGASPFGIDCSGLAQLCHHLSGYTIPRDADMQFQAGTAVEEPFRPGDLLFFHSETRKDKITHVGLSTGGWNMIHSSRARNGVYEEDVKANENLTRTFAGARRFIGG